MKKEEKVVENVERILINGAYGFHGRDHNNYDEAERSLRIKRMRASRSN